MKTRITALVWVLVLTLLTSVALGSEQPIGDYASSSAGLPPTTGILKDQNDCPPGTAFFKNQFPGLTNGPGTGSDALTFPIDGTDVTFSIWWMDDNSFEFLVTGGVAHIVGVTSDTNTLLYDYVNFYGASPQVGAPVSGDGNLNKIADAADVNHLDLCLAVADPGDTEPPVVDITSPDGTQPVAGIVTVLATVTDNVAVSSVTASVNGTTVDNNCQLVNMATDQYACTWDTAGLGSGGFTIVVSGTDTSGNTGTDFVIVSLDNVAPQVTIDAPLDGAQVSGTVTVIATISDDSGVATSFVEVSINDDLVGPVTCIEQAQNLYECKYEWDTVPLSAGLYKIELSATDTLGNTTEPPVSISVEVVKLFADCFGTLGDEDFDPNDPSEPDYAGGCKPTDLARVQTPPDTDACTGDNPPNFCFLSGTLLKPANPAHCGDFGFPDPRMVLDAGEWVPDPSQPRRALKVFEEVPLHTDVLSRVEAALPANSILADAVVLDENTYCANGCCAIAQHAKGYVNGSMQGDELQVLYPVWPQDPPTGLVFIKTHFPEEVLDPALVCECYDETDNPDLQKACGAGYSPLSQQLDDYGFVSVLTQRCVNPARTLTRNNGFDVSNLIETAGIDFETDPVGVLNFKYGLSEDQFGLLFAALDCAEPLLLTGKFSDVSSPVNQAKRRFDNFNPKSLQQSIDALGDAAAAIRTQTTWQVTEKNCPGEALGRIEHLIWDLGLLKRELERLEALGIL